MAGGFDWFRWHHGTVIDPKWRVVARKSGANVCDVLAVFACFLERASQAEQRGSIEGWAADDIGAGLDMDADQVCAIYGAMQGKVLDGDILSGWEKRQPKREREDSSADRVRKHRATQRQETPSSDDVTPCNATQRQETPREEKSREDKKAESTTAPDKPPRFDARAALSDLGVADPVLSDWLTLRKQKRAPVTMTALAGIQREAVKAGLSLHAALEIGCKRGWQGFESSWIDPKARGSPAGSRADERAHVGDILTGRGSDHGAGTANERDITGEAYRVS